MINTFGTVTGGSPSEDWVAIGGKSQALVTATAVKSIKKGAGRLCTVLVSAAGSAGTPIYDASGDNGEVTGALIGYVKANPAVGDVIVFNMPATKGIYVPATANGSGFTVSFN